MLRVADRDPIGTPGSFDPAAFAAPATKTKNRPGLCGRGGLAFGKVPWS